MLDEWQISLIRCRILRHLIWVYTVCSGLSVQIFRVIMIWWIITELNYSSRCERQTEIRLTLRIDPQHRKRLLTTPLMNSEDFNQSEHTCTPIGLLSFNQVWKWDKASDKELIPPKSRQFSFFLQISIFFFFLHGSIWCGYPLEVLHQCASNDYPWHTAPWWGASNGYP